MRLSYSNMCGSDYLLQENKMEAFFTSGNQCREHRAFQLTPGLKSSSTPGLKSSM